MKHFTKSLSLFTLEGLPNWSAGPKGTLAEQLTVVAASGYEHVELVRPGGTEPCHAAELSYSRSVRINTPNDAGPILEMAKDEGCEFASIHLGWGMESDAEAHRLIEATLQASLHHNIPAYVELHRATILQDARRTINFIDKFPEMRFTADFSHWYVGHEMVYGGLEKKLAFIAPVFSRVRHIHGRIADPGCIQVTIVDPQAENITHFQEFWRRCIIAVSEADPSIESIPFTVELLQAKTYYARCRKTEYGWDEESDRWLQAQLLCELAQDCFSNQANHPMMKITA